MRRSLPLLTATLILSLATPVTQAAILNWDFSGTIAQPTDANPVGDPVFAGGVFSGVGTDTLTWGSGADPLNVLSINASSGSTSLTTGVPKQVQFGSFSWLNASVFGTGGIWDTVLTLDLTFGSVTGSADLVVRVNNTEDNDFDVAVNNQTGQVPDVLSFLSLTGFDFDQSLGDGVTMDGLSMQLLSAGQCGTANPDTTGSWLVGDDWTNCEGNTAVLGLFVNVRYDEPPTPISLPATGWLLLAGIGGLGLFSRSRRKDA